jgi:hypothetical protein
MALALEWQGAFRRSDIRNRRKRAGFARFRHPAAGRPQTGAIADFRIGVVITSSVGGG